MEKTPCIEVHTVLFLQPHPNGHRLMHTLPVVKLGLHFTYKEEESACAFIYLCFYAFKKKKKYCLLPDSSFYWYPLISHKKREWGRKWKREIESMWHYLKDFHVRVVWCIGIYMLSYHQLMTLLTLGFIFTLLLMQWHILCHVTCHIIFKILP